MNRTIFLALDHETALHILIEHLGGYAFYPDFKLAPASYNVVSLSTKIDEMRLFIFYGSRFRSF